MTLLQVAQRWAPQSAIDVDGLALDLLTLAAWVSASATLALPRRLRCLSATMPKIRSSSSSVINVWAAVSASAQAENRVNCARALHHHRSLRPDLIAQVAQHPIVPDRALRRGFTTPGRRSNP
jgi:hypothetical protein